MTFCVLLWAHEGCADDLTRYEDKVLRLVVEHRGRVVSRVRMRDAVGQPDEIQVLQFTDAEALDEYMNDPRRIAMLRERDRVVARTDRLDAEILT